MLLTATLGIIWRKMAGSVYPAVRCMLLLLLAGQRTIFVSSSSRNLGVDRRASSATDIVVSRRDPRFATVVSV